MKFKLDENLGERGRHILEQAGHEVSTVAQQGFGGVTDESLIAECLKEGKALVTLDLDFANPLRFRPSQYPGIAVLRLPIRPNMADLARHLQTFVAVLNQESLVGRLWIVEQGRVRIYQEPGSN